MAYIIIGILVVIGVGVYFANREINKIIKSIEEERDLP